MRVFPLKGRPCGEHPSCVGLPCLVPFLVCCLYGFSKQVQWHLPWFRTLLGWKPTVDFAFENKHRLRGETDKLPSDDSAEYRVLGPREGHPGTVGGWDGFEQILCLSFLICEQGVPHLPLCSVGDII